MSLKKIPTELLEILADGKFHSGEVMAGILGVSRAAVWKKLQSLEALGIYIETVKGKGYRLIDPLPLLDKSLIQEKLCNQGLEVDVTVIDEIDSTNAELLRRLQSHYVESGSVVVAESQLAGRGRRGRKWISPLGKNLNFSMSWSFQEGVASLDGLSLVVGLSLIQALELVGVDCAKLKWPNDVLIDDKKLAGVLLEITGDPAGLCHVVIGIGVNIHVKNMNDIIDQPWISVDHVVGRVIDRNTLVVFLIGILASHLQLFESQGFAPFIERWKRYDALYNQEVVVYFGTQQVVGTARGITESGEFVLETEAGVRYFNGGEVSLRRQS